MPRYVESGMTIIDRHRNGKIVRSPLSNPFERARTCRTLNDLGEIELDRINK